MLSRFNILEMIGRDLYIRWCRYWFWPLQIIICYGLGVEPEYIKTPCLPHLIYLLLSEKTKIVRMKIYYFCVLERKSPKKKVTFRGGKTDHKILFFLYI